jgi:Concanavalin A-like lectin/glucanases superfamily
MSLVVGSGITVESGITIASDSLILSLDAATYSGSGPWIDTVSGVQFDLYNNPVYSASIGGGTFQFDAGSGQYANSPTSLPDLPTWSAIAWHYFTDTNTGGDPCIISEVYPGNTGAINYVLGSAVTSGLQAAYYAPGWVATSPTYYLVANTWNQIAGTYDGNTINLYVNNTLVATANSATLASSSQGGINLMRRWDLGEYWGGYLSIVKVYAAGIGAGGVADDWAANAARFGL